MSLSEPIEPMLAHPADQLPAGEPWRYEPKWDGFRCIAIREGKTVRLQSRNKKYMQDAFPEVVDALQEQPVGRVLDGELMVGRDGDYSDSFTDLQSRLRVTGKRLQRLVRDLPVTYVVFDQLAGPRGGALLDHPFDERRAMLAEAAGRWQTPRLQLSPQTPLLEDARAWMAHAGRGIEGVVAKRGDAAYEIGRRSHAMLKVKVQHTIDCVVGGIGTESNGRTVLLLGLHDPDDGLLHYVGQTSPVPATVAQAVRAALPEASGDGGFNGRQPALENRWSKKERAPWQAVPPRVIVETAYDRLDTTFRHRPKALRLRDDKDPTDCRFDQEPRTVTDGTVGSVEG
ncbi:MAG: ATP-dependent DNA ligase [Planctomycetota bacterium]